MEKKRDFTYIEDLLRDKPFGYKNALTKFSISHMEMQEKLMNLQNMIQFLIKINYIARDKLMPKRGTLLNEKSRDLLKFNPAYKIEEGYRIYIEWYKNFWEKHKTYEN